MEGQRISPPFALIALLGAFICVLEGSGPVAGRSRITVPLSIFPRPSEAGARLTWPPTALGVV